MEKGLLVFLVGYLVSAKGKAEKECSLLYFLKKITYLLFQFYSFPPQSKVYESFLPFPPVFVLTCFES